jgi:hypothetical protein
VQPVRPSVRPSVRLLLLATALCVDLTVPYRRGWVVGWLGGHSIEQLHLGSDVTEKDVLKARASAAHQQRAVDVGVFDACRLPMRAGSVDAAVVDLPFGRRHGSHRQVRCRVRCAVCEGCAHSPCAPCGRTSPCTRGRCGSVGGLCALAAGALLSISTISPYTSLGAATEVGWVGLTWAGRNSHM